MTEGERNALMNIMTVAANELEAEGVLLVDRSQRPFQITLTPLGEELHAPLTAENVHHARSTAVFDRLAVDIATRETARASVEDAPALATHEEAALLSGDADIIAATFGLDAADIAFLQDDELGFVEADRWIATFERACETMRASGRFSDAAAYVILNRAAKVGPDDKRPFPVPDTRRDH